MTIRPATPRDAESICAIWNPVIRDSEITFNAVEKSRDDVVEMIRGKAVEGHGFLVAEEHGALLGFASFGQFRHGVGYARTVEHTVILAPDGRGRGLGRLLMTAIEDHARAYGAHSVFAGVSSGNPAGVRFHERLGYTHVVTLHEVGWKFGKWFDLHLMQKML